MTALSLAAKRGHNVVVEALLAHRVDTFAFDINRIIAVHQVAKGRHVAVVWLLLD
jgi:ankyrin repeat protein